MGFHLVFKSNFEPISEGTHLAVCDKVIDMGEQVGSEKFGSKVAHQVYIGWQVTDEGDSVKYIGKRYNLSTDKKSTLRKDLEAWLGKTFNEGDEFSSGEILGKGCQLVITHIKTDQGKVFDRVNSVMGLPKGMKVAAPAELVDFDLNENTWEALDPRIPTRIADAIKEGITYKQFAQPEANTILPPDVEDLPF